MKAPLQEIGNKLSPTLQFIDPDYEVDQAAYLDLIIRIASDCLSVCLINNRSKQVLVLKNYALSLSGPTNPEYLRSIIKDIEELQPGIVYRSVKVLLSTPNYTLIPQPLFDPAHQEQYLIGSSIAPDQEKVLNNKLQSIQAVNVFTVHKDLLALLDQHLTDIKYIQELTSILEGLYLKRKQDKNPILDIVIQERFMHLLLFKEGKLQLCNTFTYESETDIIYYSLAVAEAFELQPEHLSIELYHDSKTDQELYNLLDQYLPNYKKGQRPQGLQWREVFKELPEEQYFSLFSTHFCE